MSKSLVQERFGANAAQSVTSSVHATGASLARVVELVPFAPHVAKAMLKAMGFAAWCKNMAVPPALARDLAALLADADPCLAAFLQPTEKDGDTVFMLRELELNCAGACARATGSDALRR